MDIFWGGVQEDVLQEGPAQKHLPRMENYVDFPWSDQF